MQPRRRCGHGWLLRLVAWLLVGLQGGWLVGWLVGRAGAGRLAWRLPWRPAGRAKVVGILVAVDGALEARVDVAVLVEEAALEEAAAGEGHHP